MTAKQIDRYQDLLLERIYSAKGGDINLENRLYAKVRELAKKKTKVRELAKKLEKNS